jgi:hypothetical protein
VTRLARIEAAAFELNQAGLGITSAQAWLAVIERINQEARGRHHPGITATTFPVR